MTADAPLQPGTPEAAETVRKVIRERRTINRFQAQRPPWAVIRAGLELALWAPNHHLTQPWHFYHLGDETWESVVGLNTEIVEGTKGAAIAREKQARWRAIPGRIVVTCDRAADELQSREDYAACACAIQNLALYLWSRGVGMKWTTGAVTRDARFHDLLWIDPELETVIGLLWYGYPDESPESQRETLNSHLVEL